MLDHGRALLQLGHELGHIVGHGHRLGESLLFRARRGELRFEPTHVSFALRELGGDLGPDFAQHDLKHALAENVLLQVIDESGLDLGDRLIHGDAADRGAALVVPHAAVTEHALVRTAVGANPRGSDRASARAALRDAAERILRGALPADLLALAARELGIDGEPDRVVDDPPLGNVDRDHVLRVGLHAGHAAGLAHLLGATVDVHASITIVQQDRSNGAWHPRAGTPPASVRRRHTFVVELMGELLQTATAQIVAIDPLDDRSFHVVDERDREAAPSAIALALELVAIADATGDPALSHPRTQAFAGARPDRFELHLVPSALDERGGLVDRVRELHLLTTRVIEQPASTIAHEVADDQGHLDRIATETRLIAADDHVAAFRFGHQPPQAGTAEEVVTATAVVDVVGLRLVHESHAREMLLAALRLDVEAELLLALVVLGSSSIRSDHGQPFALA